MSEAQTCDDDMRLWLVRGLCRSNPLQRLRASGTQRYGEMQIFWSVTSPFRTKCGSNEKLVKNCSFETSDNPNFERSDATLSREMRVECQKLVSNCDFESRSNVNSWCKITILKFRCNLLARNEGQMQKTGVQLRF